MALAGPRRTEIKMIERLSSRQVTFSKRRKGLFNKAADLSLRCGAEIAVIVFSNTNKMYEFSSTTMEHILSRYINHGAAAGFSMESPEKKPQDEPADKHELSSCDTLSAILLLQEHIAALNLDCSRMMGMQLDGLSLKELNQLEEQIREGIESIEKRKIEVQDYYKYKPSYLLEYSNHLDGNNSQFFYGTSSSAVSDCTESGQSNDFVDTSLHL
jgi:hypothetical protein